MMMNLNKKSEKGLEKAAAREMFNVWPLKPQFNKSQQDSLAASLIPLAVNLNAHLTTVPTLTGPGLSFDMKI